jgi:N-acetylmuramoyl-L-alanine amidase
MLRLPRRIIHLALLAGLLSLTGASQPQDPGEAQIVSIRYWSWGDVTRVAIATTGDYKMKSDELDNPPRLYFDLSGLPIREGALRKQHAIAVQDHLIKQIRVAETAPGVTRVVFDLEALVDYSSSQLAHPDRLIIEVRPKGKSAGGELDTRPTVSGAERLNGPERQSGDGPGPGASSSIAPLPTAPAVNLPSLAEKLPTRKPPDLSGLAPPPPLPYLVEQQGAVMRAVIYGPLDRMRLDPPRSTGAGYAKSAVRSDGLPSVVLPVRSSSSAIARSAAVEPQPDSPNSPSSALSTLSQTAPAARDSQGNRSLVRVFGLKVGKVVIDPGHGGKDTGTIGPHGLREKDLVLDVALRLGQLVESRLGSQVVFTRTDDTFIPLEQRTEMANTEKADLFISIHANSSSVASATGVETYYFNFTTEKAALDLATRENATSASSIHDLNDLLQKAVLKAKVEESREFAQKVQGSLQVMSVKMNSRSRDRGVRKAPFVVLIGATMPSILAEVGFVSNPRDESALRKSDQRQKIAEALMKGIEQYASTLSHVQIAKARVSE